MQVAGLGLVHWDDPEGWYGEGGGRRVQDGEHIERGEAGGWDPAVLRGREVHLRCLGGTGLGLTPEGGLHRPQRPRRREHLGFRAAVQSVSRSDNPRKA